MTRILAIGDIMGRAGRQALEALLPRAKAEFSPDIIIANGENAAGGCGLTRKIFDDLLQNHQIDAITMGNHWHDKREIYDFMQHERLILPANMSNVEHESSGLRILTARNGSRFAVLNLIGKVFMHGENRCPYKAVEKLLANVPESIKIRIVDMHAEATSEKQGLGWFLAKRTSLVYGTHSHVPTADERILEAHTGFVTDIGMTGPYDSVIGIRKDAAITRMTTGEKRKWEPATGNPWLCAIIVDIDDETGACQAIQRIRWHVDKQDEKNH